MGAFWQKLKLLGSSILDALMPFIKQFLTEAGTFALAQAILIVPIIESSFAEADGATKRKEAIAKLMEAAKAKGITLTTSLVNSAIETAVAKLKEQQLVDAPK